MKILVIVHKPPYPPVDGGAMATLNMCLGLARAGNKVTVLSISTLKHPSEVNKIPAKIRSEINFEFLNIDLTTNIFGGLLNFFFSPLPYNVQRYVKKSFKQLIKNYIAIDDFDLVQLEGIYIVPYIKTIRKAFAGKVVMRAHNVENSIWKSLAKEETVWYKKLYFNVLHRRLKRMEIGMCDKVDALVAISEPDKDWFAAHGLAKPSITIPVGYFNKTKQIRNLEQFPNSAFAYIGALDWIPNYEGLIWFIDWVWPHIQAEVPEAEFHIAGRNAQESLAERLIAERRVIFHGQVPDSAEFISNYPIMVVPLHSGSGIRVKIIEGMFLGRAIVCTSAAIKGIDVVDGEHVLIADTPDDFANQIIKLIRNPELTSTIEQNALEYASTNYDAVNLGVKLTKFYENLLAK